MRGYDFSTINDRDLEELTKDLLNLKYKLSLQSFKSGKDGGIDLRYSSNRNNNEIIVQVKHYWKSGYKALYNKLKNEELDKVIKLNPAKYILATSVDLSAKEKDNLKSLFHPYIHTHEFILGKSDLNDLLYQYPEIERKYYNLWLSSESIISFIINNGSMGRSAYLIERIQNRMQFYVPTEALNTGFKKLEANKLLLITGQPGIGKTTLAEMLLCRCLYNKYNIFEVKDINEAENIVSRNDKEKQVFYFDDFLGATYLEILVGNNSESRIAAFVERIRMTPNKYLILTSRTIIHKSAIQKYEKLNRASINYSTLELSLSNLTPYIKAKILYNHLFFNKLKGEYVLQIFSNSFYKQIVYHKNFTPRLIELFTDDLFLQNSNISDYRKFILNHLDHPEEIWKQSFENQLSNLEKLFLLCMFYHRERPVRESNIDRSFKKRLEFERANYGLGFELNVLNRVVIRLLDGFITSNQHDTDRYFNFINPSLEDYITKYFNESDEEKMKCIQIASTTLQLDVFTRQTIQLNSPALRDVLVDKLLQMIDPDEKDFNLYSDYAISSILGFLSSIPDISANYPLEIMELFLLINDPSDNTYFSDAVHLLNMFSNSPLYIEYVNDNKELIIEKLINSITNNNEIDAFITFFELYKLDLKNYLKKYDHAVKYMIEKIISIITGYHTYQYMKSNKVSSITIIKSAMVDVGDLISKLYPDSIEEFDYFNTEEWKSFMDHIKDIEGEREFEIIDNEFNEKEEIEAANIDELFSEIPEHIAILTNC